MVKREIKFRAWDKSIQEMIAPDNLGIVAGEGAYLMTGETGPNVIQVYLTGDLELVQYTGLKDKNGVEIYEGDIVRIENQYEHINFGDPVEIETAPVMWSEFGWWPFNEPGGGDCKWVYAFETAEVIGNLYENPELLND